MEIRVVNYAATPLPRFLLLLLSLQHGPMGEMDVPYSLKWPINDQVEWKKSAHTSWALILDTEAEPCGLIIII